MSNLTDKRMSRLTQEEFRQKLSAIAEDLDHLVRECREWEAEQRRNDARTGRNQEIPPWRLDVMETLDDAMTTAYCALFPDDNNE